MYCKALSSTYLTRKIKFGNGDIKVDKGRRHTVNNNIGHIHQNGRFYFKFI